MNLLYNILNNALKDKVDTNTLETLYDKIENLHKEDINRILEAFKKLIQEINYELKI